jgi:uncharacterized protein (TIGR03086 family)
MDSLIAMFTSATHEFGARVNAVTEDQWSAPTPDSEWAVSDLVSHLIEEHRWMPPLLHGQDLEAAAEIVAATRNSDVHGGVGANLASDWLDAATASLDAVTAPGVAERHVALSRGATPAQQYLGEMVFDACVHAWDLGKAIGYPEPLPEDLVGFVFGMATAAGDLAATGMFAPPVAVAADAPTIDRLVALTGRNPH